MVKTFSLLGSTGAIGQQALSVARAHNIKISALSGGKNAALLSEQAREFKAPLVCISDENFYGELKLRLADTSTKITCGTDGLLEAAAIKSDITLNAVVGMAGLLPTLEAINAGNTIALANKEALVAGGNLVMRSAFEKKVKIIPVDSEHSAIFQCLMGNNRVSLKKIILTASGGPFFGYTTEMLKGATKDQALRHPNWRMGQKITIDSATLMNKGLELIEAVWLFGVSPSQIEIVIHRQSIIHSAVEYIDGSVIAQMGVSDMRLPIQFALSYPERLPCAAEPLSLLKAGSLTFEKPDDETFKCLSLARLAAEKGGNAGSVINGANERAVAAFLDNIISFYEIFELVEYAFKNVKYIENPTLDDILKSGVQAGEFVERAIRK
ncbi:MAG: 1-deoxy-D-xylulose-5-phosphate reductoisomerase [Eubacterium sp.]|jgi:1-deoxy-D-xylulose-5-phosphate reductoisomerase|nr:1-deoxy-D-xylulose-5-phosphate reductoisomerase [Eubacterium sp.]